ncbi:MAG: DUF1223 domain-containing protein [Pseudoruegeria sp.]
MRKFAGILASLFMASAGALFAGERAVVVELYTSQGCSSCPPADALFAELATQEGVIALALHVDYWDYIGWKDSFARPEHTDRQKSYAAVIGKRMIYTPQMIISGKDHVVGNKPDEVAAMIAKNSQGAPDVDLKLSRDGDVISISATPVSSGYGSLAVQLVRFEPTQMVDIKRGENAGKVLNYNNIVTDWSRVSDWDGTEPLDIQVKVMGDQPLAVIIQPNGNGPILAAAKLN